MLPVLGFTGAMLFVKRSENLGLILLILGPTSLYFDAIQIDLRSLLFVIILVITPLTFSNQTPKSWSGFDSASSKNFHQKVIPAAIFIFGLLKFFSGLKLDEISLACVSFPFLFRLIIIANLNFGILKLVGSFVAGITITSLISLFQYIGLIPKLPGARDNLAVDIKDYGGSLLRFSGSVGDYELLGWSLAAGSALTFGLMLHYKEISKTKFTLFLGALILFGVCAMLTGNRATLAEIAFAVIFQTTLLKMSFSKKISSVLIFSAFIILVLFQLNSKYLYFRRTLSSRGEFSSTNLLSSRLSTWEQAVSQVSGLSILGNNTENHRASSPHNFILWALISAGVLGFTTLLVVLWSLLRMAFNLRNQRDVISVSLSSALFITLFDNMLVEPVRLVSVFTVWLLLIAICCTRLTSLNHSSKTNLGFGGIQ
jgi:hypothetical protein